MRRFQASIDLPAPPAEVFALLADPVNDGRWCDAVKATELVSGGTGEVGARYRFVEGLFEKRGREGEIEITVLDPPHRMVSIATTSDRRYVITYDLEPTPAGTRLTQTTDAELLTMPGRISGVVYAPMMRTQLKRQLRSLRELVRDR